MWNSKLPGNYRGVQRRERNVTLEKHVYSAGWLAGQSDYREKSKSGSETLDFPGERATNTGSADVALRWFLTGCACRARNSTVFSEVSACSYPLDRVPSESLRDER